MDFLGFHNILAPRMSSLWKNPYEFQKKIGNIPIREYII
jgi:hypothetical protein